MSALPWKNVDQRQGVRMAASEHDLMKHDEWALSAIEAVHRMTPGQQHHLLLHLFRVTAHHQATHDDGLAGQLCRDIFGTIELQHDEAYVKAVAGAAPVDRDRLVSAEDALARLAAL